MIRMSKGLLLSVLALALVLGVTSAARADGPTQGTIKSIAPDQNQLVVTDANNRDWTFTFDPTAKFFFPDKKDAKLSDFRQGAPVSVLWEKRGDRYTGTALLAREGAYKDLSLAEGTIKRVGANNDQFVVLGTDGKEWTYHMADNARVLLNNREIKLNEYKENDKVFMLYEQRAGRSYVREICSDRK